MSEGESRQLMVAGAAAVGVLGLGAYLWFGMAGSAPAPEAPDVSNIAVQPRAPRAGVSADGASPERKRAAPPPSMVAGLKQPSVRPPEQTAAVHTALLAIEGALQACFNDVLAERPGSKGRAILQFDVTDGALAGPVAVELRAIPSPSLRDCFVAATPSADFSGVQGQTRVLWPLLMWPDKGLSVQPPVAPLDGD